MGAPGLPTDGFPSVLILQCPTDKPFSQIHWSWKTQNRQSSEASQKPPRLPNLSISFCIYERGFASRPTLDLSGKRKQYDSASSCSVRPSCFISLRFSMN